MTSKRRTFYPDVWEYFCDAWALYPIELFLILNVYNKSDLLVIQIKRSMKHVYFSSCY